MRGDASSATTVAAAEALAQAESDLSAGRLRAAQKHARRAARLDRDSPGASLLVAATSVLLADASSPSATLLLPNPHSSPEHGSAIRRHYKSLSRSLRPGPGSSPAASAAAKEALRRVDEAYTALMAQEAEVPVRPPTFWTACAGCRLLHEFDRQYVGYRLMCPSCRRTFLASEVPPPPPPPKKPKTERPEMTLAEMQLQLAKRRAKDHKAPNNSSSDDAEGLGQEEPDSDHSGKMAVEDSDFYNFDADRSERCFKRGQVWALYGDNDGMPRHYALVEATSLGRQFRVQIRWLELQPDGEEGKPCGEFKVGRAVTVHSVNVFSHLVACERVAREVYRVYPRKGSVWALHGGEDGDSGRPKYEFVVFLSGYSELYGVSFGYLEKVEGFRSIFTRRDIGSHAVRYLHKGDVGVLSHQIPARKVSKGEASTLPPEDCWELDPASLPSELLRVEHQK